MTTPPTEELGTGLTGLSSTHTQKREKERVSDVISSTIGRWILFTVVFMS